MSNDEPEKHELSIPTGKDVSHFINGLLPDSTRFPIAARAELVKPSFDAMAVALLDKYFHFGMGRQSKTFSFGSGSANEISDLVDLNQAETAYAFEKFGNKIQAAIHPNKPQKESVIWQPCDSKILGEKAFTRAFHSRTPSSIYGAFTKRESTRTSWGAQFVPARVEESEMTQIVKHRLLPVFGKGNIEVVPLKDGKEASFEYATAHPDERYTDWKITVFTGPNTVQDLLSAAHHVHNNSWSSFNQTHQLPNH